MCALSQPCFIAALYSQELISIAKKAWWNCLFALRNANLDQFIIIFVHWTSEPNFLYCVINCNVNQLLSFVCVCMGVDMKKAMGGIVISLINALSLVIDRL